MGESWKRQLFMAFSAFDESIDQAAYAGLHPYRANSGTDRDPRHNRLVGKKREATYSHPLRPQPNLDSNDKPPCRLERKAHVPLHVFRQKGSCRPVERSRYSHACHGVNRSGQQILWLPSAHQYSGMAIGSTAPSLVTKASGRSMPLTAL